MKQNNTRKAQNQRTGNTRPKGKVVPTEGVYNNHPYMHAATSQVGNIVYVRTQSGAIYEGIFRTFSPNFSVVLEVAHKVDTSNGDEPKIALETVCNTFVFKPDDIVSIHAKNVDLDYATRDTFATDTAISKCNGNSLSEDRELEPWDPSGSDCLTNGDFDLDDDSHGWDPNEMFQKNESIYGVQSTFDPQLAGYTVGIKKNTEDYREIELAAAKIASEIENNPVYLERVDLENNDELDDEEAKFSAVIRDNNSSSPLPQRQTNSKDSASSRQSEQRSVESSSSVAQVVTSSTNNTSRETHNNNNNNRDSRGSETPRQENHVDKAQSSVSPPTVQQQQQHPLAPPVIPQVSAQPERISNQGSQERSHHPHHQQQHHHPQQQQHHSGNNANNMPNQSMHSIAQQQNMNNTNNVPSASKYVPHAKTSKMGKGNRTMRGTPPPNNNSASGPPTPQSPHTPQVPPHQQQQGGKQNNYMLQQQQQPQNMGPAPQYLAHGTPLYTQHVHNQATAGKLNGQDQNNANQNNKMGQRTYRYPQNTNVNAPPPQNVGPQMKNIQPQQLQMGKPIHHVQLAPSLGHMPAPDGQAATHIVVPHQIVVQPQAILQAPAGIPNQSPMPQRQQRSRDETTDNLRKFHNNFKMDTSSQHPQDNRNQQAPQQQQQNDNTPQQQQQQQQQIQQGHQQQQQQGKPQREQRHQQQQNQPIVNDNSHQMQMQPPQQQQQQAPAPPQHQQGPPPKDGADNAGGASTPGQKKFVLNPAAKPFTPRTPATPSATRPQNSRPHTPQTPSSTMQTQVMAYAPPHTPGPIVAASPNQPQMMTIPTYVVQQPFQAPPRQPKRPLGVQPSASVQVAAATGQPLLAPGPGPFVYQQPGFPPQAYATFRMPFDAAGGQQIQYITATPPSTTPSPGQAQQFHPGPQPSPASQAATAYMPIQQQGPHVSFPVLTTNGPQIMHTQYFQPTAGPHGQPQPYILMQQPQHPSTQ